MRLGCVFEIEMEKRCEFAGDFSVRAGESSTPRLEVLQTGHPSIFLTVTGFYASEFESLCQRIAPVLLLYARGTGLPPNNSGRPSELDPRERLISFIFFVK